MPVASAKRSKAEKKAAKRKVRRAKARAAVQSSNGTCTTTVDAINTIDDADAVLPQPRSSIDPGTPIMDAEPSSCGRRKRKGKRKLDVSFSEGKAGDASCRHQQDGVSTTAEECVAGGSPRRSTNSKSTGPPARQHKAKAPKPSLLKGAGTPLAVSTKAKRPKAEGMDGGKKRREEEVRLAKVLEIVRRKHRAEIGKGRLLVGWDVAAFAAYAFGELVASASRAAGEEGDEEGEVVAAAVDAVTDMAEQDHGGQVRVPSQKPIFHFQSPE